MADAAAARREARRRRILENAEDRLKRITDFHREADAIASQAPPKTKPTQITEPTLEPRLPNLTNYTPPSTSFEGEIGGTPFDGGIGGGEEPFILPTTSNPITSDVLPSNFRSFVILLLGFAIRYLNLIFEKFYDLIGVDLSALHIGKIFMPLLAYEIGEFFIAKPPVEENSTFNLLLSLNNINPARLQIALRTLNMFLRLLRDMSLYFFAFVVLDMIFSFVII